MGDRLFLFLLIASSLVSHLLWALAIPFAGFPHGAPDEIHHFEVTRFIANNGRIPIFGAGKDLYIRVRPGAEDNIYNRIYGWQSLFPPGAYILAGQAIRSLQITDYRSQVFIARLISILYNLFTIYFAYRIASIVFGADRFLTWGIPILLSNIPQVVFVGSYHNPDSLAMMASTLCIYFGLRLLRSGWANWQDALLLGLALGLVGLSKQNSWVVGTITVFLAWSFSIASGDTIRVLWRIPLVALPAVASIGPWLVFQHQNYGDVLAREVFARAWTADRPFLVPYAQQGYGFLDFILKTNWAELTFKSFWGLFGYMSVPLPSLVYLVIFVLCAVSAVGLAGGAVREAVRGKGTWPPFRAQAVLIFVIVAASLLTASVLHSFYNDYQPQGRYLFPAAVPLVALWMMGWRNVLGGLAEKTPVLFFVWAAAYLFNLACLAFAVVPGMRIPVKEEWFY
ncbi:DUF2142 domain-containing protein [Thermoflexus sp.]|uniref:DUF2142 domain-containing protein n=1 Tax=Thermoflexus sp. TaxID=1969742 RepID=UPI002ADE7FAF|nr:DUF2142 domain-containing protein [Thermoflexus sp.]